MTVSATLVVLSGTHMYLQPLMKASRQRLGSLISVRHCSEQIGKLTRVLAGNLSVFDWGAVDTHLSSL